MLKTIIFDLGNVIIDINADLTLNALKALGIERSETIFTLEQQSELCDQLEVGHIDGPTFLSTIASYTTHDIDESALIAAWEAMVLHTTPARLRILQSLRDHYQVFLLSNTNEIHYNTITDRLGLHGIDSLESLFDRTYLSYRVGHRKPTAAIFEHVTQDAQLNPAETLFIDDLPANLEAPKAMGWQTWHAADINAIWSRIEQLVPRP